MALTSGTKLGPYEIQSPLGAGGMGEVYRAHDSRLGRDVAIKVLPPQLQADPDLKARFEREARAISSLQHAHICTLFDVGHQDGIDYLVMEYLEGETLAARLLKGPLPLDQVLTIAIQTADALERAHRHGIIHRDLKPGNIMLTKSGAKLMDFGLAKGKAAGGMSGRGSVGLLTPSTPTMNLAEMTSPQTPLTQKGLIVGTFQYMAPEVLQGAEADARSDIFSFGCALYEMTAGKRPFDGKSQVGVLAAILERDPEPISMTQPMTPPALDKLIRTCLAKDPEERWQSAHDLKLQLEAISEMGSKAGVPAAVAGARRERKRLGMSIGVAGWVLAAAALAGILYYSRQLAQERQPIRTEIELPTDVDMNIAVAGGAVISPDGKKVIIPAVMANGGELWVHDLTTDKAAAVPGTQGAMFPFWSPDSGSIGFFSNGKMRTVPAGGGPVQIISEAPAGRGGAWSQTGVIVFTPNIEDPLYKVSESGGTRVALTKVDKGTTHRNPIFLPDGKHFLFVERLLKAPFGDLYVGSIDGGEPKRIVERASNAVYAQGYILYLRDRNLVAQKFSTGSLSVNGNPVPVAANIDYWNPKDLGDFSVSTLGTLIYRTAQSTSFRFAWMKLPGKETEEFGETMSGIATPMSVSSDGHKVAFVKRQADAADIELWYFDIDRNMLTRQGFSPSGFIYSGFSPDGTRLGITYNASGSNSQLKVKSLVTAGEQEMSPGIDTLVWIYSWTPDGKSLLMNAQDPKTLLDIYVLPLDGGKAIPLLHQSYDERDGDVSPNGKWMAYESDESGRFELYVTDFPGVHSKMQISSDGTFWHQWSGDGKRLYSASGKKLLMTEIRNPDTLELGNTTTLAMLDVTPLRVASDGRVLVLKRVNGELTEPLRVVTHFPESVGK
jgi:Tol biopolymer transport system component